MLGGKSLLTLGNQLKSHQRQSGDHSSSTGGPQPPTAGPRVCVASALSAPLQCRMVLRFPGASELSRGSSFSRRSDRHHGCCPQSPTARLWESQAHLRLSGFGLSRVLALLLGQQQESTCSPTPPSSHSVVFTLFAGLGLTPGPHTRWATIVNWTRRGLGKRNT